MFKVLEYRLDLFGETETAPAAAESAPAPEAPASAAPAAEGNMGVDAQPQRDGRRANIFPAVPKVDIRRPTKKMPRPFPTAPQQQAAPAEQAAQTTESFDELIKGRFAKEYGEHVRAAVQERFKSREAQDQRYEKAMNTLMNIAPMYGINAESADGLDLDQLSQAISDDDRMYEQEALEKGVPTSTLKHIKQLEQREKQRQLEERRSLEQETLRNHIAGLRQQEEELRKEFPDFDLNVEAQNPAFARMTGPGGGLTLRQAYMAIHGDELLKRGQTQAVTETKRAVSQAIQAGSMRPSENGLIQSNGGAPQRDPRTYTREERAAIRRRVMAGETVRP